MNWWIFGLGVYLFIDQLIDFRKKTEGVVIRDVSLAIDPDFIAALSKAVADHHAREMRKSAQDLLR